MTRDSETNAPMLGQLWKLEYEGELDIEGVSPGILLKIQILSKTSRGKKKRFRSRIYRRDLFRTQPFAQSDKADHEWFVLDDDFPANEFQAPSRSVALRLTLQAIRDRLAGTDRTPEVSGKRIDRN